MANQYYPLGGFFRTRHGAFVRSRVGSRGGVWEPIRLLSGSAVIAALAGESAALTIYYPPDAPSDMVITWGAIYVPQTPMRVLDATWTDNSDDETTFDIESRQKNLSDEWQPWIGTIWDDTAVDATSASCNIARQNAWGQQGRIRSKKTIGAVHLYSDWVESPEIASYW